MNTPVVLHFSIRFTDECFLFKHDMNNYRPEMDNSLNRIKSLRRITEAFKIILGNFVAQQLIIRACENSKM
mgnify:CR=1 FL=1